MYMAFGPQLIERSSTLVGVPPLAPADDAANENATTTSNPTRPERRMALNKVPHQGWCLPVAAWQKNERRIVKDQARNNFLISDWRLFGAGLQTPP
jgi:hypothetical protein